MKLSLSIAMLALSLLLPYHQIYAEQEAVEICSQATVMPGEYRLNPGDLVSVEVWREEDLTKEVLIRPDGAISLPLIGDVQLAELTLAQAKQRIEEKLQKYVPEAVATISLLRSQGNQVYVIGKVNNPGDIALFKQLTLLQALSIAGGTTVFADVSDIKLIRHCDDGKQVAISFDYTKVASGKDLEQNIVLQSGDVIVVP